MEASGHDNNSSNAMIALNCGTEEEVRDWSLPASVLPVPALSVSVGDDDTYHLSIGNQINMNRETLLDNLEPTELLRFLRNEDLITTETEKHILAQKRRRQKLNLILDMFISNPESLCSFHSMLVYCKSELARLFTNEYLVDLRKEANQVRRAVNLNYERVLEEITPEGVIQEMDDLLQQQNISVVVEFHGILDRRDRAHVILRAFWRHDILMVKFKEYMNTYHNIPSLQEEMEI